jgi:ribonuclease HI
MKMPIVIFADGASSGNPGPSGWGAIIVYPVTSPSSPKEGAAAPDPGANAPVARAKKEGAAAPDPGASAPVARAKDDIQVTELGGHEPASTNNRMEMAGVICALEFCRKSGFTDPIAIHTDSTYVIRGATQWSWGWRKKGWKTAEGLDVANVDLWKRLLALLPGLKITWNYVRGHAGIPGNERVDEIAVAFSKGYRIDLYRGSLLKYGIAIYDLPENGELPEMRPREEKRAAHSYLSYVGGIARRHATWAECERAVKGQSGAKFKKAMSDAEESKILSAWGLDRSALK